MTNSETISVIVPAAGCGARAALNGNKILAPLREGRAVLFWTLNALFHADYGADELVQIIVVARADEFAAIAEIRQQCAFSLDFDIVEGGATRQDSVYAGAQAARGSYFLVHDAARPCVSPALVRRTLDAAKKSGAAIAALPVSDSVKRADARGNIAQTLDRSEIWLAQTPQIFKGALFLAALETARNAGFQGTDCASLLENSGIEVALVEGDARNLKITFAADLARAAAILNSSL